MSEHADFYSPTASGILAYAASRNNLTPSDCTVNAFTFPWGAWLVAYSTSSTLSSKFLGLVNFQNIQLLNYTLEVGWPPECKRHRRKQQTRKKKNMTKYVTTITY